MRCILDRETVCWVMSESPQVAGVHQRDAATLSFYNLAEAVKLVDLVEALLRSSQCLVGDIGVIAPFRKQVRLLHDVNAPCTCWVGVKCHLLSGCAMPLAGWVCSATC